MVPAFAGTTSVASTARRANHFGIASSPSIKNILLYRNCKSVHNSPSPRLQEGTLALVTERWRGLRWPLWRQVISPDETFAADGRSRVVLAPRPWRQVLEKLMLLRDDGGKKRRSPGRARISRKPLARGKPGCLGCTCQTRVRFCLPIAHGAAGAVGARLSLRPLPSGGTTRLQSSGEIAP